MKKLETECIRDAKVTKEEYDLAWRLREIRDELVVEYTLDKIKLNEIQMIREALNRVIERITVQAFLRDDDLEAVRDYMGVASE